MFNKENMKNLAQTTLLLSAMHTLRLQAIDYPGSSSWAVLSPTTLWRHVFERGMLVVTNSACIECT